MAAHSNLTIAGEANRVNITQVDTTDVETEDEREQRILQQADKREVEAKAREDRILGEAEIREELDDRQAQGRFVPKNYFKDIELGAARGAVRAIEELYDGISSIDDWVTSHTGSLDLDPFDGDGIGWNSPEQAAKKTEGTILRTIEKGFREIHGLFPETETAAGEIADVAARFIVGALLTRGMGVGVTGVGAWGIQAIRFAGIDFAVFDGHEERLADMLVQIPALNNPVTRYLAVDEEDPELLGRMKSVIEGLGIGVMAEGIIRAIRTLKLGRRLKNLEAERKKADELEAIEEDRFRKDQEEYEIFAESERQNLETRAEASTEFTPADFGVTPEQVRRINEEAVSSSSRSPDSLFHVVESPGGAVRVVSKDASISGGLNLHETEEYWQALSGVVEEGVRGRGNAVDGIEEAIHFAFSRGKQFATSDDLTLSATYVFEALRKRGYTIVKEAHHDGPRGNVISNNGEPLYRVTALPEEVLSDLSRLDTKRISIGKTSTPDEMIAELRKAADEGRAPNIDFESLATDRMAFVDFMQKLVNATTALKRITNKETKLAGFQLRARHGDNLASELVGDVAKDSGLAARVHSVNTISIEANRKMQKLAREGLARGSDDADAAFMQQMQLTAATDAFATGSRRAVAQATQASSITKAEREAVGGFNFEDYKHQSGEHRDPRAIMQAVIDAANDPKKLAKIISRSRPRKILDVIQEVFYGSLLSAPSTHLINTLGNAWKVGEHIIQRTFALGPAAIRGEASLARTQWKGMWLGMVRGFQESFQGSLKILDGTAWKKGFAISKLSKAERIAAYNELDEMGTVWKAMLSGEPQIDAITKLSETGGRVRAIEFELPANLKDRNLAHRTLVRGLVGLGNLTGGIIRLPGKVIITVDEFFKTIASNMERYSLVYAEAANNSRVAGSPLKAVEWADELLHSDRYVKEAKEFARSQTFQNKLGTFGTGIEQMARKVPGLRLIFAFVRTPGNLLKSAATYVPGLNLLAPSLWRDLKAGGKVADMAYAKLVMSTGLGWYVAETFYAGNLRGGGSRNNSAQFDGVKRYSIKLGDKWWSFDRLDPLGMSIGFMADIFEMSEQIGDNEDLMAEIEAASAKVMMAFANNFVSKHYLRSVSELIAAFSDAERGSANNMKKWIGSTLGHMMPLVGANFERRRAAGQDEFARYIFSWVDEFRSRIPEGGGPASLFGLEGLIGNRKDLGVRRTPLGRAVPNDLGMATLWQDSEESDKPLDRMLASLDFNISLPARNIDGVGLDTRQYSKFLFLRGQEVTVAGKTLEDRLTRAVAEDNWLFHRLPLGGQQKYINTIVRAYTEKARNQLLREDPELSQRVDDAKAKRDFETKLIINERAFEKSQQSRPDPNDALTALTGSTPQDVLTQLTGR